MNYSIMCDKCNQISPSGGDFMGVIVRGDIAYKQFRNYTRWTCPLCGQFADFAIAPIGPLVSEERTEPARIEATDGSLDPYRVFLDGLT